MRSKRSAPVEPSNRGFGGLVRRVFSFIGPGVVTGASDDDPSGIGTYTSVGAAMGYSVLWTAPYFFPLVAVSQYVCAKIGLVTGHGLTGVLRRHHGRGVMYPVVGLVLLANTINAGADIGAIAAAVNLLIPVPIPAIILPIALSILALLVWGSYRLIEGVFKWLTLTLLAYLGAAVFAHPDPASVLSSTLIPTVRLDSAYLAGLVALLGTTISPYLFFWQASAEVETHVSVARQRIHHRRRATDGELRAAAMDVHAGMLFATVVMYAIMLASAATLYASGRREISSAVEAAQALRPIAGDSAAVLLALGLIGSGFLAVPILVGSSAYAVSEAFGWRSGLNQRPAQARQFYLVMAASTLVGIELNFLGIDPIAALFGAAVVNGFLAPPLLAMILLVARDRSIMGDRVNSRLTNAVGWLTVGVMAMAAVGLVVTWLRG
ncbi:MAG: divalent metal cation transporter [Chloroflexota bacterium]